MNLSIKQHSSKEPKDWDEFCSKSPDAWFWHTSGWREYTLNFRPLLQTTDLSFWIYHENKPVAIVPLTKESVSNEKNTVKAFSSSSAVGAAIPSLALAEGLNLEEREKVVDYVFAAIDDLARKESIVLARFCSSPLASISREGGIQRMFFQKYGYLDVSLETLLVDLHLPKDQLWKRVRRNHHRNVKKGEGYKISFYTSKNVTPEIFEEYKTLHTKAAGRQTRPDRTFELMYEWLKGNIAFLVAVQKDNKNIAFEYFSVYKNSVYAFSAANDPDYETQPIRHALEWEAILWMKEKGFDFYEMDIQYKGQLPHDLPDRKLMSISLFKKGFGGFSVPQYLGEKYYDRNFFLQEQTKRVQQFALSLPENAKSAVKNE